MYITVAKDLALSSDEVLQVVRPLYGIPESGLHWYLTYLSHHLEKMCMKRTRYGPFLIVRREGGEHVRLTILQVNDSLCMGTDKFLK